MTRQTVVIENFSGGLDLVSSLNTIPDGYTPNALNFRIAEYGGLEKILGYSAYATLGGAAHELTRFKKRDGTYNKLVAALATSWQSVDSSGVVANIRTGLNSVTDTTFAVYEDKLYGLDLLNGLASWSGSALDTASFAAAPKGIILGVWQNQLYIATATAGAVGMQVQWSDPGDFTSWPVGNTVFLGGPGTVETIVGGVPMADALVIFCTSSTYAIFNEETGANRLVDPERGCSSRKSLAVVDGSIIGVCSDGLFTTNGSAPLVIISRRIDPLFVNEDPVLAGSCGVKYQNSYLLSYRRTGSTNNLTLDVTASTGAIMANQYPINAAVMSDMVSDVDRLYFVDASDKTKVRRAFHNGTFAGNAISCYYDTAPMNFGSEQYQKRVHRVRVTGRGALTVAAKAEFVTNFDSSNALSFGAFATPAIWGTGLWDDAVWGGYIIFEGWSSVPIRGRRLSFRIAETGTTVFGAREPFDTVGDGQLGGAGVYLIEPQFTMSTRNR